MKRIKVYTYVQQSDKAVKLYQEAFDATLVYTVPNDDGTFFVAELDINGWIFGVAERNDETFGILGETVTGNVMQVNLEYSEEDKGKIMKAYEVLKTDAQVLIKPQAFDHTSLCFDLIDKFGVRWGIYVME